MTAFPRLFSPLTIGPRTVKNRICCSAHADALAEDGMPTERTLRYYELKARGGAGLVMCFGSASVHPTSPARDWNGVELFDDRVVPHLRNFSEAMHRHGAPCVAQITHRGRRGRSSNAWQRMYAPSAVREPNHRETPHPLDPATMRAFVRAFADAAGRLQQGGFDGCEVMASHCHLIDQFWTPRANRRGDEYGGELANRLRFGVEVLRAVRERVGRDFLVGIRMTGDELVEGGLNSDACQEIAGQLDELALLDFFDIIGSTAETYRAEAAAVPDMSFPVALYCPLAAAIKAVVRVPVIATGRINDPAVAERVLGEGQADLCVMTRALIADPDLPNKAREGRLADIRPCFGYNEGCIDRIYTGRGVTCVQNAVIGRAWDVLRGKEVAGRRVLVIDEEYGHQGPSAAEYLLDRGHDVHLVTSERSIGSFLGATTGPPVFQRLFTKGVTLHCNLRVVALEGDRAVVRNVWSDREEALGPYDAFVYAYGGESVCGLEKELEGKVRRVELIGDCFAPRSLQHAILEGHQLAREL